MQEEGKCGGDESWSFHFFYFNSISFNFISFNFISSLL